MEVKNSRSNETETSCASLDSKRQFLSTCSTSCFWTVTICDDTYRDRGFLISVKDRPLHVYNSIARDISLNIFKQFWFENRLVELSKRLKESRIKGAGEGEYFEELFLGLCFRLDIQTYLRVNHRTMYIQSKVWFRFYGKYFHRRLY